MSGLLSRYFFRLGGVQWTRSKGHSKWQNIRNTKQAKDNLKGSIISRHCNLIRIAITQNGKELDPKKNSLLAKAIKVAKAEGVPNASIDKTLNSYGKGVEKEIDYIIKGPGNARIAVISSIPTKAGFQCFFSTGLKKNGASLEPSHTLRSFFEKKGSIFLKGPDSLESAEEVAIEVNAEEVLQVSEEGHYEFITDSLSFAQVRDRLFSEFPSYEYLEAEVVYSPTQTVSVSPQELELVNKIKANLKERIEVISVHDNIVAEEE
uniref:UPF0082 protein TTE1135 n=1 Tax=Caligus rogercresseyi TaxID=217165 RepID=C1BR21_CALRO|nr:UPF0082 protein TTE1135 [Caligus rogercresseyi]